jgi:transcriptional regulator with XRE-family HTH domain
MPKELIELQRLAEAAGTNLNQLCKKAGVARSTPTRWLGANPKAAPNTSTLNKLRKALEDIVAERQHRLTAAGLIK